SDGWHTSFRLNASSGVVALTRLQDGAPAVMDYITYASATLDRSFGSYPDGNYQTRRLFYVPTPGEPNNSTVPNVPLFINEWMASNRSQLIDPVTGRFEDWIEIYNSGSTPIDLGGYYLSDSSTNLTQFRIPPGTIIPAEGFLLVWANGDPGVNGPGKEIHTNFRLSADGEVIVLSAQDGTIISSVTFGKQSDNVSQGRYPDAAEAPYFLFNKATPRAANAGQFANQFPLLAPIADVVISEGNSLTFKANGSDSDVPGQTLTYSLVNPPAGAQINSSTGDFSWTPNEEVGPAIVNITVRVIDNGAPPLSATRTMKVTVEELNQAPTLSGIADVVAGEGSPLIIQFAATDADLPAQGLTFSLVGQTPEGAAVGATDGVFHWTPAESHGPGTYIFTVRVTDDGPGNLYAERQFTVNVMEVNNAPIISPVVAQSVDELALFEIAIVARDPDSPAAKLTYNLISAPQGVSIDSSTGILRWTPAEDQGPFTHQMQVRVTEQDGGPSSEVSFAVGVREVNSAPMLETMTDVQLAANQTLNRMLAANDSDEPKQALAFSAEGLPEGATLDPNRGLLRWEVGPDPKAGNYAVTVQVVDSGSPNLSSQITFNIVVTAEIRVVINEIMFRPSNTGAEFVELANGSQANPVDLSGWRLVGLDYQFPQGTILPAGGFLCVARNLTAFRNAYGTLPIVVGNATLTLPQAGGLVQLIKPGTGEQLDQIMDEVLFEMRAPWPAPAFTQGASLQLIDMEQDHRRVSNWSATSTAITNQPVNVISFDSTWRFYQGAASPGAAWNATTFNDGSWSQGKALFFVEDATLAAPKVTPLTLGRTSYYFRTSFNFAGNVEGARLRFSPFLDDGAVFYLNGQEALRVGMPDGAVSQDTFATRVVGDAATEAFIDVAATGLKLGENIIAVEVHQANAGSSDVVFGATVELISVQPASFTPGARNSIAATVAPFPAVWINEVVPENVSGLKDRSGAAEPWIELYNDGDQPLSLDGWTLTDHFSQLNKWRFPIGTVIPANGYLVVFADGESNQSGAGEVHTSFRLAAQSGSVALARTHKGLLEVVDYINYLGVGADQSYGRAIDGQPFVSKPFQSPTPAMSNHQVVLPVAKLVVSVAAGHKLQLKWNGVTGVIYKLQTTTSLENQNWETIDEQPGILGEMQWQESINQSSRFYRLMVN
ncbi:MAG: lamin tail domain-containing protein, partial [Verrucomicrobiales bacterium]